MQPIEPSSDATLRHMLSRDLGFGSGTLRKTHKSMLGTIAPQTFTFDCLAVDSGRCFGPVTVAYQTYGALNAARDNAVLICHPLRFDAHLAGNHGDDGRLGWWEPMVGPGRPLDTDRYFLVCMNVLGGCNGTTGPASIDPATGRPYARSFPVITIDDIVRAQCRVIDHLGIPTLRAVIGGGFGGAQALSWSVQFPDRVRSVLAASVHHRTPAYIIAMHEAMRHAIMADADWNNGDYYDGRRPAQGMVAARMFEAVTSTGPTYLAARYGRLLHADDCYHYDFGMEFSVERQLQCEADALSRRFDAHSYLTLMRALDYFDLTGGTSDLRAAFAQASCRYLFISYDSDPWFPPSGTRTMAAAAHGNGLDVVWLEAESHYGHESYLLETEQHGSAISRLLASA